MSNCVRPEQLLAGILSFTEEAIFIIALDGTIERWSRGAERLFGYEMDEIIGRSARLLAPPAEASGIERLLTNARRGKAPVNGVTERVHKNGSKLRVNLKRTALQDEQGRIVGILEAATEVTPREFEDAGAAQLGLLMAQMPGIVWTTDKELTITANWGLGLPYSKIRPGNLVGHSIFEYLTSADRHATPILEHCEALRGVSSHFEYRRKHRVMEIHLAPLKLASGETAGCIGLGQDITDKKKSEEEIRYQATHDALTGLANYRAFIDTLEREVRRAERNRHVFTILLLDMDLLKPINDRLGHLAGNRALVRLAKVTKEQCRATDLAARYGGDEFAVVLIESDSLMAQQVVERIQACLRQEMEEPALSVSIGVGIYPEDGRTAQDLLEAADRRLYCSKKDSRNRTMTAE
jgi:diguanylate cyclase (GGDEF)-like protein/PAS domain S-box-containing protein